MSSDLWQVTWFTAWVAVTSTLVILPPGIALAWLLARRQWPGKSIVETLVALPLVIPPGCGFRVGAETREWKPGEAFVFDDTIDHEAWNNSDTWRAVLIVDIWNPYLSHAEREMVKELTAGVNDYYGDLPAYVRPGQRPD